METMELNLNEMEQVNGGTILGLLCVLGVVGGAIGMAFGIGHALKDSDVKISNGITVSPSYFPRSISCAVFIFCNI